MRILAAAIVLSVVLAGCAGDAPATEEEDDVPQIDRVAAGKGAIRGVVIDGTVQPIEGVTVEVQESGEEAVTGPDGTFTFVDLDPGAYFLLASKPGWGSIQQSTIVEADIANPPAVRIQMLPIPGTEPAAITFKDEGFVACGWGVPITYGYCGEELGKEDDYHLEYIVNGEPDWIQVEIIWKNTQPASENLYLIQSLCPPENYESCPGTIAAGERWGEGTYQSPAVIRTPAGFMDQAKANFGKDSLDQWWVGVDVSADGPAFATGATLDQPFVGYVTMFWNIDPDESWTFEKDGEYPVPS